MNGTRTRLVSLLGAALLAIAAVGPASADTVKSQSGTYGSYQVNDFQTGTQGVKCVYDARTTKGKHQLGKLRVRKPFVHSATSGSQWVGWRFIVKRDHDTNGSFQEVYRSGIVKAKATQATIAPFSDRVWSLPNTVKGNYKVWLVLFWYKKGTKTVQTGKVVTELDWYRVTGGGDVNKTRQDSCYRDREGS